MLLQYPHTGIFDCDKPYKNMIIESYLVALYNIWPIINLKEPTTWKFNFTSL